MATLVLTAVGSALGGPIGAALGVLAGQQIDRRLLAPKGGKGPRLNEFAVQSSHYGQPIPLLFGANRVAGSVIWATDLKETRKKVSNGKGQPKSTVYSYSASFAVLLSARPVAGVGRIWADGNLLRGGGGEFRVPVRFRLHHGSERQEPDPLIASDIGIDRTPALRGCAYAVFEDLELGDFGNRIPSLSFEVFADAQAVLLGDVIASLAPGLETDLPFPVGGVAVAADSVRALAEPLAPLFPMALADTGAALRLSASLAEGPSIRAADLGAAAADGERRLPSRSRRPQHRQPATLEIVHYEPARDYQQGLVRAGEPAAASRTERIELPFTIAAPQLKGHAAAFLSRSRTGRITARISLPWRALDLSPGQRVRIPGDSTDWRVAATSFHRMVVEADLVAQGRTGAAEISADHGQGAMQPDLPPGPTSLRLIELPATGDGLPRGPRLAIAAAGVLPGWRRATLLTSVDGEATWQEAGRTAAPAIIGMVEGTLGPGPAWIEDAASSLDVRLLHGGMALADADMPRLLAGANAAMVGSEIIQFARAMPTGPDRYRLGGLLRGRRGTEWAIAGHAEGEAFTLLDEDLLTIVELAPGTAAASVLASGAGDAVPVKASTAIAGEAVRPPSPVRLAASADGAGGMLITWQRRSRTGWAWLDGVDAPLGEDSEAYEVTLAPDRGASVIRQTVLPRIGIMAEDLVALAAGGATTLEVTVRQRGTAALSRPTALVCAIAPFLT